ncbi:MAG: MurR/RpiR family transcriptional regulator [Lachnospiraceae bacterium]|nr:MurR/RpiR family transcriptional regulator [Lachnospiraceae bacterium]
MGLIKTLKNKKDLTEREVCIRDYILKKPECILSMSSRELGEATYSSAAAVTRFCQKLGCKGYPDFRMKYISDIQNNTDEEEMYSAEKIHLVEKENAITIMNKIYHVNLHTMEKTKKDISLGQITRVSRLLDQASYVDFYAVDLNVCIADYGCNQFIHCGKIANTYHASNLQELVAFQTEQDHIAIVISHTGENEKLVKVLKILKRRKVKTIALTYSENSTIGKLADETFIIDAVDRMHEFSDMWSVKFIIGVKYIIDVLFAIVFSLHYEENVKLNDKYEFSARDIWNTYAPEEYFTKKKR